MFRLSIIAICLFGLSLVTQAKASGFFVGPSLFYQSVAVDNNGTTTDGAETSYDLHVGYDFGGLYAGILYSAETYTAENNNRTSTGVSIGYMNNGWHIIGSYILSSEEQVAAGSTRKEGSGIHLAFGHLFQVTSSFSIGPQLKYYSYEYNKLNDTEIPYKETRIIPFVGLGFKF